MLGVVVGEDSLLWRVSSQYVEPLILPSRMLHRGRKASALITKKCTGKIYK